MRTATAMIVVLLLAGTALAFAWFGVEAELVGDTMPWLLLLAALGSQTSAIIGATSSRSDMLVSRSVPRKYTFLIILIPSIL